MRKALAVDDGLDLGQGAALAGGDADRRCEIH